MMKKRNCEADLMVTMENIGRVYAQYISGFIYIPKGMVRNENWESQPDKIKTFNGKDYFMLEVNNSQFRRAAYRVEYRIVFPHLKDLTAS